MNQWIPLHSLESLKDFLFIAVGAKNIIPLPSHAFSLGILKTNAFPNLIESRLESRFNNRLTAVPKQFLREMGGNLSRFS